MAGIVIIGGGHAGGQAAASLRGAGFDGPLTVIGNEAFPPYQRPPLSKQYLAGKSSVEDLYLRPPDFFEQRGVELLQGRTVVEVDVTARSLRTDDDHVLPFDQLLFATGARPRMLDVPGIALGGIHYLRTIADVDRIRAELADARRLAIVGGGYIGLEVAAVATTLGMEATVLEAEAQLLPRVATPELAAFYRGLHERHGVAIRTAATVRGFEGTGRVQRVLLDDGDIAADLVIVGIGVVPNTELAVATGLECNDGIIVDERCRTSVEGVYAAGDCTRHPNPQLGGDRRLESVPNALDQAKVAAANMTGGDAVHDAVPWFWSDQYGLKLQMVGFPGEADQRVMRGDPATDHFAIFHLRGNTLVGVDAVSEPKAFLAGKKLFGRDVDAQQLADPATDPRKL